MTSNAVAAEANTTSAATPHVLALDLGTSGMKVALITYSGHVTAWASHPVPLHLLPGGGAEQDPNDWWTALVAGCAQLARRAPEAMASVQAVSTSTQGEGTIAVDAAGNLLTRCILWMDMRGEPNLRKQFGGRVAVNGVTPRRIARWLRLTGGMPSATGKDPAAHMLFIRDELPEVYDKTATFLNVLDYFNLRLAGKPVATVDSILTSWVTDNRNPDAIEYHDTLIADLGVESDKLPQIVRCTDVLGPVLPQVADELGIPRTARVVAGAIDNTAAAIGVGTIDDYEAHLYLGTSSWIAAHVPYKRTDVLAGIASLPCAIPGRYLLTALQATAGGNMEFVRTSVLGGEVSFESMEAILAESNPGAGGVIYTPWIYGERAPVDDLNLRAGLFNVSLDTSRADMMRSVYEGVALNTRWLKKPVDKFLGRPMSAITLAGGGAKSAAWCQIFADVLGVEVRRTLDPVAVNAQGAAWIAAVGIGELSFDDIPSLIRHDTPFEPNPQLRELYDAKFDTFVDLHKRLAPVYKRLAKRVGGPTFGD